MADIDSVGDALASFLSSVIYPDGESAASITGTPAVIKRGWLQDKDVTGGDCSLSTGVDFVTVIDTRSGWKLLSEPLGRPWRANTDIDPTISVTTSGNSATVSVTAGAVASGIVGLVITPASGSVIPPRATAAYAVKQTDTPTTIASALASVIPGAVASGASLSVPSAARITGVVGGYAAVSRVTRWQSQRFQITVWSGSPEARGKLGGSLDAALSACDGLTDVDGSGILLTAAGQFNDDSAANPSIYRRDMLMDVRYGTVQSQTVPKVLFGVGVLSAPGREFANFGAYPLPDGPVLLTS